MESAENRTEQSGPPAGRPAGSATPGPPRPHLTASAPAGAAARRPVNWQRRLAWLAAPLLITALLVDMLWFAPLDQTAAAPNPDVTPLPLAAVDPFGSTVFLEREVDRFKKDETATLLGQSGLHWIRQEFPWSEIEFQKGHFFDDKNNVNSWAKFDEIVRQAQTTGLQIIARLDRPPDWARAPGTNNEAPPDAAHMADWGNFVAQFVQRYKGQIHFLQIWNEPNLEAEWIHGRPVSAAGYVQVLAAAAQAARGVDPNIVILSAPLAPTNESYEQSPGKTDNLRETAYLQEMYQAGAAQWFDIMSANAFGYNDPPEADPGPDRYNLRRVEYLRDVMVRNGDARKPVWFTEYAWDAPSSAVPPDKIFWGQVTLQQQADYTVRGIQYARAHWPWAGVFVIWYFRQVGDIAPTAADYYFAMVSPDFVPQPLYRAVQSAAAGLSVAGDGPHGPLTAPVHVGPGWDLQVRHTGPAPDTLDVPVLVSRAPTATLTITFRGTDLTLLFAPPDSAAPATPAPHLAVTVDGQTAGVAGNLPRDAAGKPYVDLAAQPSAPPDPPPAVVPLTGTQAVQVVSGLGNERAPGVHTVTLRPDGPGARVAGYVVTAQRSYVAVGLVTGLLILLLAADVAWLRRGRGARPA